MHPEKFSDHAELHNYAERHGLEYLWEGTQAFERRKRTLPPEQFEICEARTHRGMRKQNALACGPRTRLGLLSHVLLALGIGLLAALVLVFAIGTLLIWIS